MEQDEKPRGITIPSKNTLMRASYRRSLTNDELLLLESGIFYYPVSVLETHLGEGEYNKRPAVTTTFNALRWLDNLEDGALNDDEKPRLIQRMVNGVIAEIVKRDSSEDISDIIKGKDMVQITKGLVKGSRNESQRIFAENFGRGVVLDELHSFDRETKEYIEYACLGISSGMTEFLQRGEIQTTEQLDHYCHHVAGRIGSFLTRITRSKDKLSGNTSPQLRSADSERFGTFLQLVNIIQNVRQDHQEKRAYFPAMFRDPEISHKTMVEGVGDDAKEARRVSLESMIAVTQDRFADSIAYVLSIPGELRGYKTFNVMLLASGKEMLETMRKAGAEKVFKGEQGAVQLSVPTLKNVYTFSSMLTRFPDRTTAWLEDYQRHPEDFTFKNGAFRKWSEKYTSRSHLL